MPDAPPEGGDEGFEADVAARVKAKLDRLHELAERAKRDLGLHYDSLGVYVSSMSRYYRAAVIYLQIMPKHPKFSDPKSQNHKAEGKRLAAEAIGKTESLNAFIKEAYEKDARREAHAARAPPPMQPDTESAHPTCDELQDRLDALKARIQQRIGKGLLSETAGSASSVAHAGTLTCPPGPASSANMLPIRPPPQPPRGPLSSSPGQAVPSMHGSQSVGGIGGNLYPSLDSIDALFQPRTTGGSGAEGAGLGPDGLRYVHLPGSLIPEFLCRAKSNSDLNCETCGILAGKVRGNALHITALLIPKQTGGANNCNVEDDIPMFNFMQSAGCMTVGWIHTHPSQTAFLSSVDLHTHCPYQMMVKEAIAIVCSIKYNDNQIFRLTTPKGLDVISSCRKRGFHPHDEGDLFHKCQHIKHEPDAPLDIKDFR